MTWPLLDKHASTTPQGRGELGWRQVAIDQANPKTIFHVLPGSKGVKKRSKGAKKSQAVPPSAKGRIEAVVR